MACALLRVGGVMKIVKNAAAAAGSKSGVAVGTQSFKSVMSGAKRPNGTLGKGPMADPARLPKKSQPFSQLAQPKTATKPPPLPGGVASKPSIAAAKAPGPLLKTVQAAQAGRETARAQSNAKADHLVEVRKEAVAHSTQRYDTRLVDLICQELKIEYRGDELGAPRRETIAAANSDRPQAVQQHVATVTPVGQSQELAKAKNEAEAKAASAIELIEKIETFVKSQRPGLALTLDGSLGARVEIERLGPKEVAIRVVGKNGPPAPEDIGRIREEMRARGLKVGALSVA